MTEHESALRAYETGDFETAHRIWQGLADSGDSEAQSWMGALCMNGEGTQSNFSAGFQWYLRAAESGHPKAQANVGAMYFMGQGVEQDPDAAFRWSELAASAEDLNGIFNLAVLCTKGVGTQVNEQRAAELYLKAAKLGHYPSQSRLGYLYAHGKGVEKDRVRAFLWLSLAAQHGIGAALEALEGVVAQMSAEERAQGEALFDGWRGRASLDVPQVAMDPRPG